MTSSTSLPQDACCAEYAALSRRSLLRGALALGGATTMVGSAVVSASASSVVPASSVLVVLSLRGAADGLSLVVPYQDPAYYQARPRIAVPADQLLQTDGQFGLQGEEIGLRLKIAQRGRVANLDPEPFGGQLDRRLALRLAAACGARRLGVGRRDLMPGFVQRQQRWNRELGRAHEDDPHCHPS